MKSKIFALLGYLMFTSLVLAESWSVVERITAKHRLSPLMTSAFAKEYPNIIPVTRCAITSAEGGLHSPDGRFVFSSRAKEQPLGIFCYAKNSHLGVAIPASAVKDKTMGLVISAITQENTPKLSNLDRVAVANIFGTYRGIQGGLGFLANLGGSALFKDGIVMTITEEPTSMFNVNLSYRKLKLEPRNEKLDSIWNDSPWSLIYQRGVEGIDWETYRNYTFVDDDANLLKKVGAMNSAL